MSKQHCRTLQVERFFRQCQMLLRHCCSFWQQCCRFQQQCRTKFCPFDNVETNWTCSICFDFVERTLVSVLALYGSRTCNRLTAALRSPDFTLCSLKRQIKAHLLQHWEKCCWQLCHACAIAWHCCDCSESSTPIIQTSWLNWTKLQSGDDQWRVITTTMHIRYDCMSSCSKRETRIVTWY